MTRADSNRNRDTGDDLQTRREVDRATHPGRNHQIVGPLRGALSGDDLIPVIKKYPQYLGIGLSEDTAIVVTGDTFEVIGRWKVAVHDNTRAYQPWEKPYFVLSAGDIYNMKTRKIEKYGIQREHL